MNCIEFNWDMRQLDGKRFYEAIVDTGDMVPANRSYDSMGFTEAYRGFAWQGLV